MVPQQQQRSRYWDITITVDKEAGSARAASSNALTPSRAKAFEDEVQRHLKWRTAIIKEGRQDVLAALQGALAEIDRRLAQQPADWQLWHLGRLRSQVAAALGHGAEAASNAVKKALARAEQLGESFVPDALGAAGVQVPRMAPGLSADVVENIASFCTSRMQDVTHEAQQAINHQLSLTVLGVQTPFEATRAIHKILGADGAAMARSERIVRTEVARVYALAQQSAMERAAQVVPGLHKQWRRSGKMHSRKSHDRMDGVHIAVLRHFKVSRESGGGTDKMLHPLDPGAPVSQTVNCGCTCIPWMPGWQVKYPDYKPFSVKEIRVRPERSRRAEKKEMKMSHCPAWRKLSCLIKNYTICLASMK